MISTANVFGLLRNRNFQAGTPSARFRIPAYTRVQAGAAFGGPDQERQDLLLFSLTKSPGARKRDSPTSVQPVICLTTSCRISIPRPSREARCRFLWHDTSDPQQAAFLSSLTPSEVGAIGLTNMSNTRFWLERPPGRPCSGSWPKPVWFRDKRRFVLSSLGGFSLPVALPRVPALQLPASYQTIGSQAGNFSGV